MNKQKYINSNNPLFIDILIKNENKFWKKVIRNDKCWSWNGSLGKFGYGKFRTLINNIGIEIKAHRASYFYYHKIFPFNLCVLHKCDNPICVNPDHLFLGTRKDNNLDKVKKNRQAKGERTNKNKLKEKDIIDIKNMIRNGMSHREIAKIKNVGKTIIGDIHHNRIWKHIQD